MWDRNYSYVSPVFLCKCTSTGPNKYLGSCLEIYVCRCLSPVVASQSCISGIFQETGPVTVDDLYVDLLRNEHAMMLWVLCRLIILI